MTLIKKVLLVIFQKIIKLKVNYIKVCKNKSNLPNSNKLKKLK